MTEVQMPRITESEFRTSAKGMGPRFGVWETKEKRFMWGPSTLELPPRPTEPLHTHANRFRF